MTDIERPSIKKKLITSLIYSTMAKTKEQKRKAKRKVKLKNRCEKQSFELRKDKANFFYHESLWLSDQGEAEKALFHLEKALRLDQNNKDILEEMVNLGYEMERVDVELKGLLGLYNNGLMGADMVPGFCDFLAENGRHEQALSILEETLSLLPQIKITNKKKLRSALVEIQKICQYQLQFKEYQESKKSSQKTRRHIIETEKNSDPPQKSKPSEFLTDTNLIPKIPVSIEVNSHSFTTALFHGEFTSPERYELALDGYRIRFKDTFENLICLNSFKDVRSLWYQEETARKILKSFRGRALLSDEVGLGKTIEAGIIFKEYIQRGMVKSALILTPTPLVSQWKEEMKAKFGLDLSSTDDPVYRIKGDSFWEGPFILASINLAKSKKNFPLVTGREYDLVIVDEAHHLKNKNTLNWKLVNALKKRFLLLLTATPVENNLMELYNLITLLKPGQLKTATAFRKEFMTRGDPTDPQNRTLLKELLGQVMIRNTRALAKIDIPPRFAQTIKVDSSKHESELYERIYTLVKNISETNGTGHKLLIKNLLAEAGSSPRAVSLALSRMLVKRDIFKAQEKEIQAINNLCRTMGDTRKNKVLLKLVKSSPGKIIIFVKYIGTLDHLSDFLTWQKIPHALFHGGMDNRKKDEQIKSFREEKDVLVSTEIGGEGRNLQFCHQMINYDLPWNPMKIEQRIGRIHRIGQEKEVMIYNLCAKESVEDYILEVLDKKINMFEMVIGEIDMILGRIKGEQEFSEMVYDIWLNSSSQKERKKAFDQLANRLKRSKTSYEKTKALDEKLFGENYEL